MDFYISAQGITGFQSLTNKSSLHWNAIKQSRVPIKAKGHKYSAHICVDTVQYVCVYIYICINMYMLHYKESAIQDFLIARILLPPAIPESSVH